MDIITTDKLRTKIYTIRGVQVMLDRDLAELYGVQTKVLNQAVKRNKSRFPDLFCFKINKNEFMNWRSQIVTSNSEKMGISHLPYAFTEQGVAMLSTVIRSETAIKVSIEIMETFVKIRKQMHFNDELIHRLIFLEKKQNKTDEKIDIILKTLEVETLQPQKCIFFDGQLFDAYVFATDLIKSAIHSIVLIDNYIDETTLLILDKRKSTCKAVIYTQKTNSQIQLDLAKHNQQYPPIEIKLLKNTHDRFLILDNNSLCHIGASIKDLGKKWFAFSRIDEVLPEILTKLGEQTE